MSGTKTLSLKNIEEGLSRIRGLGHQEDTFTVMGTPITLRTLRRGEMEDVQQYCYPLYEEAQERDDAFSLTAWVQAVKQESLAYAIMAIGDIDFRGIEYVETGQEDPETGKEIRVQKHVFVRTLLEEWEESVLETIYKKFQELTDRAADKARDGVVFREKAETETRIQELEAEIAELRERLKTEAYEEETQDTGINIEALREQVFSPVTPETPVASETPEPSQTKHKEEGEYVYASSPHESVEDETHDANEPEPEEEAEEGPFYVDADGKPLQKEALDIARENDRLYQERMLQRQSAARRRGRQPLNNVDAHMPGDRNRSGGQQQEREDAFYITAPDARAPETSPQLNPEPVVSGNPMYQPPHKK